MGKARVPALDLGLGVVDDGQRPQAKKIHLQKAQALDLSHVELGHRQAVVGRQGHIFGGRLPRDDHTGRMGRCMPGHAFHFQRSIDELVHLRIGLIQALEVGGYFQRVTQRHFLLHRDELGHLIHVLVGHAHHPPHVAHGGAGGHSAKGHDLGHMVPAILFVDVVDDLLPTLVAKVHVKVRHGHTLGVQEPFEDQIVTDGINVGDANAIGRQATRAGPAPGAHGDAAVFGVVDEVVDDEVVVGIPHLGNDADLIIQAFPQFLRHLARIPALEPFAANLFKVGLVFHAIGRLEIRELRLAVMEIEMALLGNAVGVLAGFGHHRKQVVHLVGALDVEFVGAELHAVGVGDGLAGLDAQQNALHLGVLAGKIMRVVGRHQRDAGLAGKADQLRQDHIVLFQTVVLKLDVIVALAKQVLIVQSDAFCPLIVPGQDGLGHLPRQTGRQADQAFVVLFQQVLVDAGLGVKTFEKAGADHLDQVFVAGLVFAQQDQMVVAVDAVDFIVPRTGGHVHFAPDDGLNTGRHGGVVELDAAVHNAVVGDGHGGLAQLLDALEQPVDAARAVQQTVFGVQVQVCELTFGSFRHCFPFHRRAWACSGAGLPAGCV